MASKFSTLKPGMRHRIVEYARGHGVQAAALRYGVEPNAIGPSLAARTQSTERRLAKLVASYAPAQAAPCPVCGAPTEERACKVRCLKCRALVADCSDVGLP